MPINNEGRLLLSEVLAKQVDTDWPEANTNYDLYINDLIAAGNVRANGLIIRNIEVSDDILTGNITASSITSNTLVLDILTANTGTFENLTVTGNLTVGFSETTGNATITYDDAQDKITFNKSVDINGDLSVSGDLIVEGNTVTLNTATLTIEDKNILLANGAPDASTADGAGITIDGANATIIYSESGDKFVINKNVDITGNVIFGAGVGESITELDLLESNIINANVLNIQGIIATGNITANVLLIQELLVTGNITANGITIRGIEVSDAVLSGNITAEGGISGNTIVVDSITANTWNELYTANVIETSGNLYFTVPRARSAFTAGENIVIDDGEISALVPIAVTNENQVFITEANVSTYSLNRVISDPNNILVTIEGLLQLPTTDYTVADDQITFVSGIPIGANVEIRYFGLETINTRVTLVAVTDTFVGDGSNVEFTLSVSPPNKNYVLPIIDGVSQQTNSFSISGFKIVFTEPPPLNSSIDVRVFGGKVGGAYNTRTFVGDGSTTEFVISSNFDQDAVLIFENGIAQVPDADYTVNSGILTFVEPPASNVVVQVRELGGTADTVISQGVATTGKAIAMSIVFGG